MLVKNFKELEIWKVGSKIALHIYRVTGKFPRHELFGMTSQMRRAAVSIPSNIAEGFGRFSKKDFGRFLQISLGSCSELETQVYLSRELNYLDKSSYDIIIDAIDHEQKMLKKFVTRNIN